jgi:hypothetical protein
VLVLAVFFCLSALAVHTGLNGPGRLVSQPLPLQGLIL